MKRGHLLLLALIVVAEFAAYNAFFPGVTNLDEFVLAQDGIAVGQYVGQIIQGYNFISPVQFALTYQQTTLGLMLNVYPPLIPALYAVLFIAFGTSLFVAKLLHLLAMILFLLLFARMVEEEYDATTAYAGVAILLLDFSFMKYFSILYREIIYVLFLFLAIHLLRRYLKSHNRWLLYALIGTFLAGSLTKDFFVVGSLALIVVYAATCRWNLRKIVQEARKAATIGVLLSAAAALLVIGAYYVLKLGTSATARGFFEGGVNPVSGLLTYGRLLFQDNLVLLLAFLAACGLIAVRWRTLPARQRQASVGLGALLLILLLFISAVNYRELRYVYFFYPIAAMTVAFAFALVMRRSRRLAFAGLLIVIVGVVASSAIDAERQATYVRAEMIPRSDPALVQYLVQHNITGNLLILANDFRPDIGYYLRTSGHNLDHSMIDVYLEKKGANSTAWSRFTSFFQEHTECEQDMPDGCWQDFLKENNVRIVIAENQLLKDQGAARLATQLGGLAPAYASNYSRIYLLPVPEAEAGPRS